MQSDQCSMFPINVACIPINVASNPIDVASTLPESHLKDTTHHPTARDAS